MRYFASENRSSGEGGSRSGEAFGSVRARAAQGGWRPEAVMEALLESVDCGILLAQADGVLWAINQRLAEIWGQDAERVRELRHLDEVVAQIAPQFANSGSVAGRWRQRFHHGEAAWDELELVKPKRKILERYARPVLNEDKRAVGWLEIYRDVSERQQMQSRLFLSERLAVLGQMLTGVAHELNNPLTSILGYAQLVQGRARDCEAEARHILEEAERARRIARNLLLFARGSKPERNRIDLNDIVEHTVAIRGYELRLENIRVELDLDPGLPEVIADGSQIQQALLNLMLNAEQAIRQFRENGTIWIRTRQASAGRIALEVADDGPGVPAEAILHVFDPFFTTKPAGVGTGLGLSILYGIVHQHGGEVSVGNRPGGGAVFTMELPSSGPASGNEKPYLIRSPGLRERSALEPGKGARILVLEDEPTVVRLIADVLREEGHVVDTVLDSREGLELARTRFYELVICDLRMPHVDGRAFYRELVREQNPLQHRLVFVTGDTLGARTVDFLRTCGLPYLAKPFRVEELKEMVGRRSKEEASLRAGPISRKINRMGNTGAHMSTEYLIQIICANPDLTREYINEFQNAGESFHLRPIAWLAEVRQPDSDSSVFLLDESAIEDRSKEGLEVAVNCLAEAGPVIVVAAPERQAELTFLLSSGAADFVARTGNFVPVAAGLVERRIRLASIQTEGICGGSSEACKGDFGEILRHEVNNPLTGILGNAEMLLARRDRLPASAVERLETIANLAVRLRETVRRLSSAAELRQAGS